MLFKILTDDEMTRGVYWYGPTFYRNDLNSANELINNNVSSNGFIGNSTSWNSGFFN